MPPPSAHTMPPTMCSCVFKIAKVMPPLPSVWLGKVRDDVYREENGDQMGGDGRWRAIREKVTRGQDLTRKDFSGKTLIKQTSNG
ncbi:putative thylakoid lumenal 15 kDa protein 1, chloroplastic [Sesbania bispinosa]|nr:putative thylakoid lumenal 15 kDa protein 1, chloroplastic [Sesbania bispinosa]